VSASRWLLATALLVLAQVVDVAVLARSPLAGLGADLTLLVVVALALVEGPVTGAAVGLVAGLLADLTPPVTGPLGLSALGYALAGVVAGRRRRPSRRSAVGPAAAATVVAATGAAVALGSVRLVTAVSGTGGRLPAGLPTVLAASVVTAAVLSLAVVPLVVALDRRAALEAPEVFPW
jgi:rod shape-determining protein MreD